MAMLGARLASVAAATLGCCWVPSQAQLYTFDHEPVPLNRSLQTLYAFYVYSFQEAPDNHMGRPFVKFSSLNLQPTGSLVTSEGTSKSVEAYESVQLSMMRYRDFWKLIDPKKFCSGEKEVQENLADKTNQLLVRKSAGQQYKDVDVYAYTVRYVNLQKDFREWVQKTGVYILIFSNCGGLVDMSVTGSVIVKNAYGFLPGDEYHKMPFYGWLLLFYVFLAVIWMGLSIRWWKDIFQIQNCIAAVIFFGLVECFLWYIFFNDWNSTGVRGKFFFVLAILFTVIKSAFSYMLILVASLGWGVTRPFLDSKVTLKIQVLCLLYIVLDFIREAVLSFRHSHSLSIAFVLLCLLPVSLLNGAIFSWVFTALSTLMETLKERRQLEKLALFQKLWAILLVALALATCALFFQIFSLSRSVSVRWKYQWLLADGVSHILFLFVLVSLMYLWAPNKYSQRYAYSQPVGDTEEGEKEHDHPGAIWADDDVLDDAEDGETFWAATKDATVLSRNVEMIGAANTDAS